MNSAIAQEPKSSAPLKIKFESKKLVNLVNFVYYLSNHPNNVKKFALSENYELTQDESELLYQFKAIYNPDFRYSYFLSLEKAAAQSESIDELIKNLPPHFRKDYRLVTGKSLKQFEYPFERFVWSKTSKFSPEKIKAFTRASISSKLVERFGEVRKFLNCSGDKTLYASVFVSILPANRNDAIGRDAHCNGQIIFLEAGENHAIEDEMSTLFHELVHLSWLEKSQSSTKKIENYFEINNGVQAYKIFQESMPTALAAGWFSRKAFRKPAKYWYEDETVRQYAEALEPLVEEYLNEGRTIDSKFCRESVRLFEKLKISNSN